MLAAYKEFWKNYVNFEGRSTRSQYWFVVLINFFITFPFLLIYLITIFRLWLQMLDMAVYSETVSEEMMTQMIFERLGTAMPILMFVWLVLMLYNLATLLPWLALTVRRLRDAGYHWALIFLGCLPIANIALLVLLCMPSKPELPPQGPYQYPPYQ